MREKFYKISESFILTIFFFSDLLLKADDSILVNSSCNSNLFSIDKKEERDFQNLLRTDRWVNITEKTYSQITQIEIKVQKLDTVIWYSDNFQKVKRNNFWSKKFHLIHYNYQSMIFQFMNILIWLFRFSDFIIHKLEKHFLFNLFSTIC